MRTTPKTLQDAIRHFSDEQTCIDTVAHLRWQNGKPECPKCQGREHYYLATQKRWKCKKCGKQFSVKVGTVFEDSPIPLDKWLTALWMLVNCKNGVSSYEVHRAINVTQKSAWFMLHRLRFALRSGSIEKMGGGSGPVQCDETFVGGTAKFMHKDRRERMRQVRQLLADKDRGWAHKTAVFGMFDGYARKVRATVVPDVKRDTLQAQILQHVAGGSTLHTDESSAYFGLREKEYVHEVVNHAQQYVRDQVHTNGLENFWSLLKRGLKGTYVAVEPFHLDRYVDEQVFRFNNRKTKSHPMTDYDRFELALRQVAGKRLTYAELTGKEGGTPF